MMTALTLASEQLTGEEALTSTTASHHPEQTLIPLQDAIASIDLNADDALLKEERSSASTPVAATSPAAYPDILEGLAEEAGIMVYATHDKRKKNAFFTEDELMPLSQAFAHSSTYLRIRLKKNTISTICLAYALSRDTTLQEFDLTDSEIDAEGALMLSRAIKRHPTLLSVNLAGNLLKDTGVKYLCNALKHNMVLHRLNIRDNNISQESSPYLQDLLSTNNTLISLKFDEDDLGDAGMADIAEALKTNTGLTKLHLFEMEIGDAGAQSLAEALKHNTTLKTVKLHCNNITNRGANRIAQALKNNKTIKNISLYMNSKIDEATKKAITAEVGDRIKF